MPVVLDSIALLGDASAGQSSLQKGERSILVSDSTALALLGRDGGDTEMECAARADTPEEIDTDEDDAEFDERAHWGRRRATGRKSGKFVKKKALAVDKNQPKINLFCVVAPKRASGGSASSAEMPPSATEVVVEEISEDGNGGSSTAELVVQTHCQSMCVAEESQRKAIPPAGKEPLEVVSNPKQQEVSTPPPAERMQSGRSKRQVVLKAEKTQKGDSGDDSLFLTPPPLQSIQQKSASDATLDGEPDRKVSTNSSLSSSGRKRKLEMAGEKKKCSQSTVVSTAKGATATSKTPSSVFFLTEEQKKQVIEIEAVSLLKEKLREQRERDVAFFGVTNVKNAFFHTRAVVSSQKITDVNATEVIEVLDTPEPSPMKPRKSRWSKQLALFPSEQHVVKHVEGDADADADGISPTPSFALKRQNCEEIVIVDDEDEAMEASAKALSVFPDGADVQIPFDDLFWMLSACTRPQRGEKATSSSPTWGLSADELVERVSELYGLKEKRVRKTLNALEAARVKRQGKSLNLSLVDKYLPVQINGMIGNKNPLKKLAAWLSAWKHGGGNDSDRNYDDSLFAFEGDDSKEDEDGTQLYRLFVLKGDIGSGKSAAVYACAEELGYEIIEINAGQLRTGKAVVDIAGEATQSTRVLHSGGLGEKKKNSGKKSKKRRTDRDASKPSHLSLVLFEDVDLIFDDDKGFLSTLSSIAKHSKCPIVVTCRHLPNGFPSSPVSISERLVRPSMREFAAWLSLVAHLEQIELPPTLSSRLGDLFGCDVRRALHFLQTYQHQISVESSGQRHSLLWYPTSQPPVINMGSDVELPIEVADSQDDATAVALRRVPAWSLSATRSLDLLSSNFLPSLRGAFCGSEGGQSQHNAQSLDEKQRQVDCLEDIWDVLDSVSLADELESKMARVPYTDGFEDDEDADFFEAEAVRMLTLDVRMLSLSSFTSRRSRPGEMALECPLVDGVERALRASREAAERAKTKLHLTLVKTKLELTPFAKGGDAVRTCFTSDYLPMIARILESSEPLQESRRRTSRRNHYLREVLLDMSAVDDILAVQARFPPHLCDAVDEIVPLSASPPPTTAPDTSISI